MAQDPSSGPSEPVSTVIHEFFEGMNQKDTALLNSLLHPSCRLETAQTNGKVKETPLKLFRNMLLTSGKIKFEEKISNLIVKVNGSLAMGWMDYGFFVNDTLSHCGSNLFTLVRVNDNWKILHIIDSRQSSCN